MKTFLRTEFILLSQAGAFGYGIQTQRSQKKSIAFHSVLGKVSPSSMITMFSLCFTVVREVNHQSFADNAIRLLKDVTHPRAFARLPKFRRHFRGTQNSGFHR